MNPMIVKELSPDEMFGRLGSMLRLMNMTGFLISVALGFLVPYSTDPEAKTTQIWKLIFIVPGLASILQLTLLVFVFKYDTPKYYLISSNTEDYQKAME